MGESNIEHYLPFTVLTLAARYLLLFMGQGAPT